MDDNGDVLAGRYRLEEALGRGARGWLWRALDMRRDRHVVLRIPPASDGSDEADAEAQAQAGRLLDAYRAITALRHPNVAEPYDCGVDAGRPYLVTELPPGRDLATLIAEHPDGLRPGRAAEIGAQVAEALNAAHWLKLVHGDLRPSTVFVADGPPGLAVKVKVIGFGAARSADPAGVASAIASAGVRTNTLAYLAPEQIDLDGEADARTDLYALGCLMYTLLTGALPFSGSSTAALKRAVVMSGAPAVRSRRPNVPEELSALVKALMAKSPGKRPGPASAVASDLKRFVADAPGAVVLRPTLIADEPTEAAGAAAPPAPPQKRRPRLRRSRIPRPKLSRPRVRKRYVVLWLLGGALVLSSVNPGGHIDKGRFSGTLPCSVVEPSSATDSVWGSKPGDCSWNASGEAGKGTIRVEQHRYRRLLFVGASTRAAGALKTRDGHTNVVQGSTRIYANSAGTEAFFHMSNLVVIVHWEKSSTSDLGGTDQYTPPGMSANDTTAVLGIAEDIASGIAGP
ncbi:serine/threonine-protein kinase [Spirillospora sp. NPDC052269]